MPGKLVQSKRNVENRVAQSTQSEIRQLEMMRSFYIVCTKDFLAASARAVDMRSRFRAINAAMASQDLVTDIDRRISWMTDVQNKISAAVGS